MNRAAPFFVLTLAFAACSPAPSADEPAAAASSSAASSQASEIATGREPEQESGRWYRSERFGFALQLPPGLSNPGSCILREPPSDGSYVTAFEDGSSVFLAPDFYGEAVLRDPGDPSSGHDCLVIENTLATIQKITGTGLSYRYGWRMAGDESISTDEQLLGFIREWHGTGCAMGKRTPTASEGTYRVEVTGAEDCTAGADYELRYSPEKHTAVTWKTGRDARFNGMDQMMADSFRFE